MKTDHLHTARIFAQLMDNQFSILGIRFGIDSLIGFIPGIGDFLSVVLSLYLLWVGYQMNVPSHIMSKMVRNVVFDAVIGTIPLAGDLFDLFFKANIKNLRILEEYQNNTVEGEIIE